MEDLANKNVFLVREVYQVSTLKRYTNISKKLMVGK